MTRWRFHQDVAEEVEGIVRWYERERPGLGDAFAGVLDDVLAHFEAGPVIASPMPEEPRARRVFLPRFPYAVVFMQTEDEYFVLAVAHMKRRPGYWLDRVVDRAEPMR